MKNIAEKIIPSLLIASAFVVAGPKVDRAGILRDSPRSALESLEMQGGPYVPPPPAPVSAALSTTDLSGRSQKAPEPKEWTILVFLNAKNNLEYFGMRDVNEMEQIGSGRKFNVAVQMGRMNGQDGDDNTDGNWTGVRRMYINKDNDKYKISSRVLEDLGDVDMGDYRELAKFVTWGKKNFPAEKYLLIVWNHGGGWMGISFDDASGNHITVPQLASALKQAGGVDVLASDACLMQMAEVAYEVKDSAKFIVGSEETEPGKGYSYTKILRRMKFNGGRSAESMGSMLTRTYGQSMLLEEGATMSSIETAEVPRTVTLMDDFAKKALRSTGEEKEILQDARDSAYKYAIEDNKDLARFVQGAVKNLPEGELKTSAKALYKQITRNLVDTKRKNIGSYEVVENTTTNKTHKDYSLDLSNKSKGVAAYVPEKTFDWDYSGLKLARDTQWDEFVQWLMN